MQLRAGAALATIAILIARRPDSVFAAQFWAEDGSVFLRQFYDQGWASIFQTYAGYTQLLPRIAVAALTPIVPLEYLPLAFNLSALALAGCFAYLIASLIPVRYPYLYAVAPAVFCPASEVVGTLTNLQWFAVFALIAVALQRPILTTGRLAVALGALALLGLTGPFMVFFALLFAGRAFILRRNQIELIFAAVALMLATLVFTVAVSSVTWNIGLGQIWIGIVRLSQSSFGPGAAALLAVLAALLFLRGMTLSAVPLIERATVALILAIAIGSYYASALKLPPWAFETTWAYHIAPRYVVVPVVVSAWVAIWLATRLSGPWKGAALILIGVMLAMPLTHFRFSPVQDFDWRGQVKKIGHEPREVIFPPDWKTTVCRWPCS